MLSVKSKPRLLCHAWSSSRIFFAAAITYLALYLALSQGLCGSAGAHPPGAVPDLVALDGPGEPLTPNSTPIQTPCVYDLKVRLKDLGFYSGVLDDLYDPGCVHAVKEFQKSYWLHADGVVDSSTWRALAHGVERPVQAESRPLPEGDVSIEVNTETLTLTVFIGEEPWRTYMVAAGKWETMTPVGEWRIVDKGYKVGGAFGSRWMALDVPWGGYGIHGTDMPWSIGGYYSVGCIRMFNEDVDEVYDLVSYGTPVRVKGYRPELDLYKNLGIGAAAPEVVALQQALREKGFDPGRCDGRYGPMTSEKAKDFMMVFGLPKDRSRDLWTLLGF